ncbi:hypothetical protein RS030_172620 [Cryptosporidium xiaoi]|uniref:Uncharacterized protein n=1 Tax=Cryptosporidium xiaoi TaxID=659607 RepID=A0AAV9Y2Y1_9CRYT
MSKSKKNILSCLDSLYPLNIGLIFETFSRLNANEIRISMPICVYDKRYTTRIPRRKRKEENFEKQYRNKKNHEEIRLEYDEFIKFVSENIANFNLRDIGYLPTLSLDVILEKIRKDENDNMTKSYCIISVLRIHIVSCLSSLISSEELDKRLRGLVDIFNKYNIEINDLFYHIEYNDLIQLFATVLRFVSGMGDYLNFKRGSEFIANVLRQCESKIERHFNSIVKFFPEILENDENFDGLNSPIGSVILSKINEELSPNCLNMFSQFNSFYENDSVPGTNFLIENQEFSNLMQNGEKTCIERSEECTAKSSFNYHNLVSYYWCLINSEGNLIRSSFQYNFLDSRKSIHSTTKREKGCYLLDNLINKDNTFSSLVLSFNAKNAYISNLDLFKLLKALSLNIGICVKISKSQDIYRHIFSLNINSILDPNKFYFQNKYNGVSILDLNYYKQLDRNTTELKNSNILNLKVIWSIDMKNDNKCMLIEVCDYLSIYVALDNVFNEFDNKISSNSNKHKNKKSKRKSNRSNESDKINDLGNDNIDNKAPLLFPTIYLNSEYFDFNVNASVLCPLLYFQQEKIRNEKSFLQLEITNGSKTINKRSLNTIKRQPGAPKRVTRLRPSGSDICPINQTNTINTTTISSSPSLYHSIHGIINHTDSNSSSLPYPTLYTSINANRIQSNYPLNKKKTKPRRMRSYSSHKNCAYRGSNNSSSSVTRSDGISMNEELGTKEVRTRISTKISGKWGHFPTIKGIKKLSQDYNLSGGFLANYLTNLTSFIYRRFSM